MDKLLNPDTGLVIWTIVTFLTLVFLLKMFAWGPLLSSIEDREARMKADLDGAKAARDQAEKIKNELEARMSDVQAKSRELLAQAAKESEALRASLKAGAESDAQKIRDKTMADLEEEKAKLSRQLRQEVAGLSVMMAEKLMRGSVNDAVQKNVVETFLKETSPKAAGVTQY